MNILHVLFTRGYGGLERYAMEQARRMAAKGHKNIFLARTGSPTAEALTQVTSIKTFTLDPVKYIDVGAMRFIRQTVRRENVDVVHVHHSADLGLAVPALLGIKGVGLLFSSYMYVPGPKKDYYHRLEYGRVGRILTASLEMRNNIIKNLPVAGDRVEVLPYGLDLARFNPAKTDSGWLRKKLGVEADRAVIGVISRLDPLKGQMEMIESMPKIVESVPGALLALTGDETPELAGKYKPTLEARVKELGLESSVVFTGPAEDTAPYLAGLDVYILPSHHETFSLGCLEAMAMGKAIVGTNSGGTPEMLDNGRCGLLAEPKAPASLAEKTLLLLKSPDLRQNIGQAARKKAASLYDMNLVMERLERIYAELAPKRG
ncbi:MAG: glycosyltransferase family 4 protein [Nitrospinae bacterium]|nr:glycosyltransferase family 4 protein [Nitrospinota bacterium]